MNRVGIFWDYENCAPPSGTPGYVVAERLRATCGAYGSVTQFRAYLELSAPPLTGLSQSASMESSSSNLPCFPTSIKTLALRSELQSSGVSLIDCPHNSRKNVADSMLACDLVCFALDNPTSQIPYANYLPASPYPIPNTPFSAISPASIPTSKTTIVLISGDRDFAYPLAVLKARKYEVGLIVPPGGAHPALRAQATWVVNWRDVLGGGDTNIGGRCEATISSNPQGQTDNTILDGQTNGFTPPIQGVRRPSFTSCRGSISSSRRGSVSNLSNPVPPPPHLGTTSIARIPAASGSFSGLEANEVLVSLGCLQEVPDLRLRHYFQQTLHLLLPQLPLQLPPPATTPPANAPSPLAKPPTPPRDAIRHPHRPPIPHVATPRPPIPESYHPAEVAPAPEENHLDVPASTSALVAPAPKPSTTVLQSLIPAAAALRPSVTSTPPRPVLAVPSSVQASSSSTLAPATPVTPPASPPLRWTRLQPVHDDTDGDGERSTGMEKRRKEKTKERMDPSNVNQSHSLVDIDIGVAAGSTSKKNSMRLAVQVGMLGGSEEPSAISGVDSILRSYTERSPKVESHDQKCRSPEENHESLANLVERKTEANVSLNPAIDDDDDDEEEQFHETFLATFSRPPVCNAPRTPGTVKLVSLELTTEENTENVNGIVDHKRPRVTTPRPVPRTSHSMPTLIPMMQSLFAVADGSQSIPNDRFDIAGARPQPHEVLMYQHSDGTDNSSGRLYSRANSPTPTPMMPPLIHRRRTSPSIITGSPDMRLDPLVDATYREFQFLINALERCRRNGQERPLRSLIGAEFTRDVFEQVGATSFKDHVHRAVASGVVCVGDGPVQGREWISLNRKWQGLGLMVD
ncbi:hypothetical protein OPQ81_004251 [Rhizoctonia solani]|nr:hypothetical protein OPQ81_004251 [Rhizoctonia solani]